MVLLLLIYKFASSQHVLLQQSLTPGFPLFLFTRNSSFHLGGATVNVELRADGGVPPDSETQLSCEQGICYINTIFLFSFLNKMHHIDIYKLIS